MTGIIVLILRILLVIFLYGFLGWAIYTIWKDLRVHSQLYSPLGESKITLNIQEGLEENIEEFYQSEINIGRDPACDLILMHETISGYHARLSYHHNQWWVEDLNSTNGTFLNNEPLLIPTVVIPRDIIQCGQVKISIDFQA